MLLEVVEVALLAAEKESDAVVGARNHQRNVPGREADQTVATQSITHQDGVVFRLVDSLQHLFESRRHARLADVVQPFGQELDVDLIDRVSHRGAQFAVEDFAGYEFQMQGRVSWLSAVTARYPATMMRRLPGVVQMGRSLPAMPPLAKGFAAH